MRHNIKSFLLLAMACFYTMAGQAQGIVTIYDEKVIKQAAINEAAHVAAEQAILEKIESTRELNDSIAIMVGVISGLQKIYRDAKANIKGFGQESRTYKQIYSLSLQIYAKVPKVVEQLAKNPVSAVASTKLVLRKLEHLKDLASWYTNVVAGGKVQDPFKTYNIITKCEKCGSTLKIIQTGNENVPTVFVCTSCGWHTNQGEGLNDNKGDGLNLISFNERYMLVSIIRSELESINWILTQILFNATRKFTLPDVVRYLDWETYGTYLSSKNAYNRVMGYMNTLKEKLGL